MDKLIVSFLIRAKQATYAGKGAETAPSRTGSHDLVYRENNLMYYDTYLGGDRFAGEEALWISDVPYWSMNYVGRVTGSPFSGDFLKEALLHVRRSMRTVIILIPAPWRVILTGSRGKKRSAGAESKSMNAVITVA